MGETLISQNTSIQGNIYIRFQFGSIKRNGCIFKEFLLFILLISSSITNFAQQSDKIEKLILQNKLEKAEKLCSGQETDYDYDCYQEIANVYLLRENIEKAEQLYKLSAHYENGLEKIADLYLKKHDLEKAVIYYEKAGRSYIGYKKVANAYFNDADLVNASLYYKKIFNSSGLSEIAKIYLDKKDFSNAAINYEAADNKFGLKYVAEGYFKNGDYQKAAIYFEKAGDVPGLKNVADEFFNKGDYINAVAYYMKANDKYGVIKVAKVYATKNDYNNASICYEKINYIFDIRDAKAYRTIKIGSQWIMADNLAYKPIKGKYWAYDNNELKVVEHGYLYDWETAKNITLPGWHIPTSEEWQKLKKELNFDEDMQKIISALKDGGSNDFDALGSGIRNSEGSFIGIDYMSEFWSSSVLESKPEVYYTFEINIFRNFAGLYWCKKDYGLSIRLIRD